MKVLKTSEIIYFSIDDDPLFPRVSIRAKIIAVDVILTRSAGVLCW